jgi:CheY-like chemotaxis protein
MNVLVAEDDLTSQLIVRRILENHGHVVMVVDNGCDAVTATGLYRFDAILIDIQMPIMDGFAATLQIRENERYKPYRTPIIAFSGLDLDAIFRQTGMDGYLPKPANPESLLAAPGG